MPKNVELSSGSRTLREYLNRQLLHVRPIFVHTNTHRNCNGALSLQTAIFLTVNFTIGIGILNFPKVFADSGNLLGSLILSGVLSVFIIGSIVILSYCVDICGADNYEDVVRYFCGPLYSDICSGTIVLYIFGGCISSFVIIGDQSDRCKFLFNMPEHKCSKCKDGLHFKPNSELCESCLSVLSSLYGSNFCQFWYMNRHFVVPVVAVTLILPLCFAKHIEFLKYPSLAGVVVSVYLVFLIIRQYYLSTAKFPLKSSNWTRATIVIPIVCYGFQTHLNWIPTYVQIKDKTFSPKVIAIIILSMLIASTSYTLVIIHGVLTWPAEQLESNILKNYDATDEFVLIGVLCIIFKIITTYPGTFFCARITIDKWYAKLSKDLISFDNRLASTVIIWILTNLMLSTNFPDIGSINDLLGTLSITFIFIHPGMCLFKSIKVIKYSGPMKLKRLLRIISISYIIIGVFIAILSIYQWIDLYLINARPKPLSLCTI